MPPIKERPILFSAAMVRSILEDRKTVTRRAIKPQPTLHTTKWWPSNGSGPQWMAEGPSEATGGMRQTWPWTNCPYGQVGDRLWVREAWAADAQVNDVPPSGLSQGEPVLYTSDGAVRQTGCSMITPGKTRPSIHMPRWASRILLEITDIRVERLQDITPAQIIAEGVSTRGEALWGSRWWVDAPTQAIEDANKDFAALWNSVGGDWAADPWVWRVEFKRVTP